MRGTKQQTFAHSRRWPIVCVLGAIAIQVFIPGGETRGATQNSDDDSTRVSSFAANWLADWDAGNWAACWLKFIDQIQQKTSLVAWTEFAKGIQKQLGKLSKRQLLACNKSPSGPYFTVRFGASFENVGIQIERVMITIDSSGKLRVAGHTIKDR